MGTYSGTSNIQATWEPNTIDLHWYNGDTELTVPSASQSCTYDGTLTPPATIPQKTGYTFKGWKVKEVPVGYTRLEYLQSTGTQYIDTGIQAKNSTTTQVIGQYLELNSDATLFGVFQSNGVNYYGLGLAGGVYWRFWYGSGGAPWVVFGTADTQLHTFIIRNASLYIDDDITPVATSSSGSVNSQSKNLILFGAMYGESVQYLSKAKIYSVKIYENGALVRNMIPAKNDSNVVGMYDTVSKTFFTNAGSGTFTAGPVAQ